MIPPWTQTCFIWLLFTLCFIVKYDQSPRFLLRELIMGCSFDPPGEPRAGPYGPSMRWCKRGSIREFRTLVSHMRHNSAGMDFVFGAEFGANVRVIFHPASGTVMVNPFVAKTAGASILCEDDIGGVVIRSSRAQEVRVEFLNEQFVRDTRTFFRGEACRVQAVLEAIEG